MNCQTVAEAEKNMVFAARLTQRGHRIATMEDLLALYEKPFSGDTVGTIGGLPHPTVQKFAVITVAVVGASMRFLAQITRHQNEVKFMSASLQYSNYAGRADFAVPYEVLAAPAPVRETYLESCSRGMDCYGELCGAGIGHDAAGYATAQGLRNVLLISATPYQWKHIIGQRICRRNTDEPRIVLLKIWQELYRLSPSLFSPQLTGAFCQRDKCLKGKMGCKRKLGAGMELLEILEADYPALFGEAAHEDKLIDFGAEESRLPYRPHGNDAGADVYMPYGCTLKPGDVEKVPLGFGIEVPDGYAGYVFPRSSMAAKGLVCELPRIPATAGRSTRLSAM